MHFPIRLMFNLYIQHLVHLVYLVGEVFIHSIIMFSCIVEVHLVSEFMGVNVDDNLSVGIIR